MRSLVKYLALAFLVIAGTARPALGQLGYDFMGGTHISKPPPESVAVERGWSAALPPVSS